MNFEIFNLFKNQENTEFWVKKITCYFLVFIGITWN